MTIQMSTTLGEALRTAARFTSAVLYQPTFVTATTSECRLWSVCAGDAQLRVVWVTLLVRLRLELMVTRTAFRPW